MSCAAFSCLLLSLAPVAVFRRARRHRHQRRTRPDDGRRDRPGAVAEGWHGADAAGFHVQADDPGAAVPAPEGRADQADRYLPVSERAWRTQGSKMFVELGARIAVEDLIRGIIIQSGNDACVVVAEGMGGTVEGFVDLMNKRAKELGLAQSHFVNPDGLPDPPGQLMSALDLAKLSRHLINDLSRLLSLFQREELRLAQHPPAQPRSGAGRAAGRGRASRPAIPMRPVTASPSRPCAAISA